MKIEIELFDKHVITCLAGKSFTLKKDDSWLTISGFGVLIPELQKAIMKKLQKLIKKRS